MTGFADCPARIVRALTYGHGATVIRYMRHFQECLDSDEQPSPGVEDGAKSVAVGVAAWESIRSGAVVEVCNEFASA